MSGPTIYGSNGKELFTSDNPAVMKFPSQQGVVVGGSLPAGDNIIGKAKLVSPTGADYFIGSQGNIDGLNTGQVALQVANFNQGFNGTSWDRWRNNQMGVLLANAPRTASLSLPTFENHNARGLFIFVDVTKVGTGTINPTIKAINPAGGSTLTVLNGATISAVGRYGYVIGMGIGSPSGAILSTLSIPLPRKIGMDMIHSDSSSWEYSVSYYLTI